MTSLVPPWPLAVWDATELWTLISITFLASPGSVQLKKYLRIRELGRTQSIFLRSLVSFGVYIVSYTPSDIPWHCYWPLFDPLALYGTFIVLYMTPGTLASPYMILFTTSLSHSPLHFLASLCTAFDSWSRDAGEGRNEGLKSK